MSKYLPFAERAKNGWQLLGLARLLPTEGTLPSVGKS